MVEKLMKWTTEFIDSLPDSAFLYVKKVGKTKIRKLPYKDSSGKIDLAHLRNAITRLAQVKTDIPTEVKKTLLNKARLLLSKAEKKASYSKEESAKMLDEKEKLEAEEPEVIDNSEENTKKDNAETEELDVDTKEEKTIENADINDNNSAKIVNTENTEETEKLSVDINKTKEELALLNEVREELVTLYAEKKNLSDNIEQLTSKNKLNNKEVEKLQKNNVLLVEQLAKYKQAEIEMKAKERLFRLSALSEKFRILGQSKTVEQLAKKDDETLNEFEKIVDAAIVKSGETKIMPSVTTQSQSVNEPKPSNAEKLSDSRKNESKGIPVKEQFYKQLCTALAHDQVNNF